MRWTRSLHATGLLPAILVLFSAVSPLRAASPDTDASPPKEHLLKGFFSLSKPLLFSTPSKTAPRQYPWKFGIVTTTFWIGERPTANNPVPNHKSSWDANWARNYGGTDSPDRSRRTRSFAPAGFTPGQNPFYVALPYNDKTRTGHKPEAAEVIPWFKDAYKSPHQSVCKGRWVAIRKGTKVCYAQWEDAGPFRTDHWEYVFGQERPRPNLNRGAGLDVSPAVRDFLGMDDTDVTDWKFVEFSEVPTGPWAQFGENNTFVINRRAGEHREVSVRNNRAEQSGKLNR